MLFGIMEANQATLKIAYMISALDGNVTKEEKQILQKTAKGFYSFMGKGKEKDILFKTLKQEMLKTLKQEMLDAGEKILAIRKKCSGQEELLKAFLNECKENFGWIGRSPVTAKKAFAVWMAIAMANHKYNEIEREAIRRLQRNIHVTHSSESVEIDKVLRGEGGSLNPLELFFSPFHSLSSFLINHQSVQTFDDMETVGGSTSFLGVSTSFLDEMEDNLKSLQKIEEQLKQCDKKRKVELQKSYSAIKAFIRDIIFEEEI